jgi:hypothetical protein
MVPPPSGSQPRCGNPGCGRPIERQATGRPACYCSGSCRQAVHRERLRLAEAERQRAERLGAEPARAGRQSSPGGEPGQPTSMPVIRDADDAPGVPAASGTQAPRAWPPWAWTVA